ncbi:MAG: DUF1854 domain-containing protein [Kiritimatiellae bacterium]|nr:DUF1854 domain-containing protein [Kiritimatiellia bacterium]
MTDETGNTNQSTNADSRLVETGVRRLEPKHLKLFEGVSTVLHCAIEGENVYRGVFAIRAFPVRYPDKYISLHYTDEKDKDVELGVIADPSSFSRDQQKLLARSLAAHYHERVITRIFDINYEYGMLFFDVEAGGVRTMFVMPWRGDRAEDYGDHGKVLLDARDNRYVIPDVRALPPADQRRFLSYIYW